MLRRIMASFAILGGEWDPDECTERLGIAPSSLRRRGYSSAPNRPAAKQPEWTLDTTWVDVDSTDDCLRPLLDLIWPHRDAILSFSCEKEARVLVLVVIEVLRERPVYEVSPQTVQRLADLGAELNFDIYDLRVASDGGDVSGAGPN